MRRSQIPTCIPMERISLIDCYLDSKKPSDGRVASSELSRVVMQNADVALLQHVFLRRTRCRGVA